MEDSPKVKIEAPSFMALLGADQDSPIGRKMRVQSENDLKNTETAYESPRKVRFASNILITDDEQH
jgi:hypothetical protein